MAKQKVKIVVRDDKLLRRIERNTAGTDVKNRTIHDGVEYGVFVELGARGRPARPNLVPAFERVTKDLPRAIGQAIEAGIGLDDVLAKAAFDVQAIWASNVPVDTGAFKNSITVSEE